MLSVLCLVFYVLTSSPTVRSEAGSCPPSIPVDVCDASCGPAASCRSPQLCCPTACGGSMCIDPVSKRHFVNLVKPGRCPEYPRGPWVSSDMCTGDADCARTLKCCANRCGALACQKPDLGDQGIPAPSGIEDTNRI